LHIEANTVLDDVGFIFLMNYHRILPANPCSKSNGEP
jgi:hypothetical protein